MSLGMLQQQFSRSVAALIQKAGDLGYEVTFGEAWRTDQQAMWDQAHGTGIANSLHRDRLAIDLNLFKDGVYLTDTEAYAELGAWWKTLTTDVPGAAYRWGGDIHSRPDGNHFSLSPDSRI